MNYFFVHCIVVFFVLLVPTVFYVVLHWLCSKNHYMVIPLLFALALPAPARGDSTIPFIVEEEVVADPLLTKCELALHDCGEVVKAQDERIENLKVAVATWKKEAEKGTSIDAPVVLTSTLSGALGGAIAGGLGGSKNGVVVGGAIGAGVGLLFGWFIERVR